ncbi:Glycerol_3-phosphate permease [Hexamita inflata]|uniref:Glycerol 3-phosphate permease n=1 Tax=Hexamita inflata TaxID=28002 RepID=A0AA86V354_9EUKA|nr:Glycerol 3-phosphate permease [Hexamita inflata]
MDAHTIANIVSYVGCIGLVIFCIITDLKHNPLGHSRKFINFRTFNWCIVGFSYAFTYMARYNVSTANRQDIFEEFEVTKEQYGVLLTVGNIVYAIAVVINGFMVDIVGAKKSMVIACVGSGVASIASGAIQKIFNLKGSPFITNTCIWYVINNYFQTFATSAICKLGVNWYDQSERGFFSGIFGVIISFGLFLAFQVDALFITNPANLYLAFVIPGCCLFVFAFLNGFFVRALPEDKFEPVEMLTLRSVENQYPKSPKKVQFEGNFFAQVFTLLKPILFQKIFYVLAVIEILLGYCRDGYLSYYNNLFSLMGLKDSVQQVIASTGVTIGGMFGSLLTGILSDSLFKSRRQPVAFIDFGFLLLGSCCLIPCILYDHSGYGSAFMIAFSAIFFNGVNGILTSTMSMDFAGSHSTGTASGVLDGIQKIGSSMTGVIIPAITGTTVSSYVWWAVSFTIPCVLSMILFAPIMNIKAKKQGEQTEAKRATSEEENLLNQEETA